MSATHSTTESTQRVLKDIPGFPGYRVGDDGTVWSCRDHGKLTDNWRELKRKVTRDGYYSVALRRFGSHRNEPNKHLRVHRLVLLAFVGPPPEGQVCRHFDGSRTNNRLSNLAWGTPQENGLDMRRHGTAGRNRGARNGRAKLTPEIVAEIKRVRPRGKELNAMAAKHGVHPMRLYAILEGKTWKSVPG